MMDRRKRLLEVCADSVESALAAYRGGADRIELCSNLVIGGTTPDTELFRIIREQTDIPVNALIRPRFGDFLYTEYEYDLMRRQIENLVSAGVNGLVIGCLKKDGSLNESYMKGLIQAAGGRQITLHRAFDVCADPFTVLEQAKELGISTILTSGQEKNCYEGKEMIAALAERSGEIAIMAGAGVNPAVIKKMITIPGLYTFHMSAKKTIDSGMEYRNPRVYMGMPGISEFEIWQTDEATVREARKILDNEDR